MREASRKRDRPANDAPLLLDVSRLIWRRWVGRHATGIDRVCLAYLDHFAARAQAVVQYKGFRRILDEPSSAALFAMLANPPPHFRRAVAAALVSAAAGPACPGRGRLYLNIGHTGLDRHGFRKWAIEADVRAIYFIHDLIPITHPELCRAGEYERHVLRMRSALETATGVIGNSQATLDELAAFARAESLPFPPGVAAWLGATALERVPAAPPDRPTFVVVGTIEGRKNHLMLLNIWSRLVDRLGEAAPRLLLIGQRGWAAEDVFHKLDTDQRLATSVQELDRCSDEQMANHLATSRALLFPSKIEGFGLPLVEALGLGVPVIASDLPVFREIGHGVPTFIAPTDEGAWEAAILDFASDASSERAAQLGRMKHFRLHDWDAHFRQVEAWLSSIG